MSEEAGRVADAAVALALVRRREGAITLTRFGHDEAWRLGTILRDLAAARGHAVTIDITIADQRVFHAALPGTNADQDDWVDRKNAVVRRFDASSYSLKLHALASSFEFSWIDPLRYSVVGGAVPLRVVGNLVGVVTVSGLSDREDHDLALAGLEALIAADPSHAA